MDTTAVEDFVRLGGEVAHPERRSEQHPQQEQ